jgi:spore germination cell wall hydrolase CwlJ-like protein
MLGQIAVAQVVMNRVASPLFPDTICEVVKQGQRYKNGKMVLHRCQFSWYCDGKKDDINRNTKEWQSALGYATIVMSGKITLDVTQGSLWYHAYYVKPSWAKQKEKVTRIDSHIFYRRKK